MCMVVCDPLANEFPRYSVSDMSMTSSVTKAKGSIVKGLPNEYDNLSVIETHGLHKPKLFLDYVVSVTLNYVTIFPVLADSVALPSENAGLPIIGSFTGIVLYIILLCVGKS